MVVVRVVSLVLLGITAAACSGAPTPDIPMTSEARTEPDLPEGATESTPSHAPSEGQAEPAPDKDDPPPPPPPPACATEAEPNESAAAATSFTTCITGTLATSKDKDFFRVVAPANVETMKIEHDEKEGKVSYRVGREDTWPLGSDTFTDDTQTMKVKPGASYLFQLTLPRSSKWNGERPYELAVSFE